MLATPDSNFTAGWLQTLALADELGLNDPYDLQGDAIDNVFYTADGDDIVRGHNGDDFIKTYGGEDKLYGGNGNDTLNAGEGDDLLNGSDGIDTLVAGGGDDTLYGGDGDEVKLLTTDTDSNLYVIETPDGDRVEFRQNGERVSADDLLANGWTAQQVAARPDGDGYLIYWENTNGNKSLWELDANGDRTDAYEADPVTLVGLEAAFDTDFNGDGAMGHVYTTRDGTGEVKLLTQDTDSDRYVIETTDGERINVTWQDAPMNDSTLDGWTALHAANNPHGDGYGLLGALRR